MFNQLFNKAYGQISNMFSMFWINYEKPVTLVAITLLALLFLFSVWKAFGISRLIRDRLNSNLPYGNLEAPRSPSDMVKWLIIMILNLLFLTGLCLINV